MKNLPTGEYFPHILYPWYEEICEEGSGASTVIHEARISSSHEKCAKCLPVLIYVYVSRSCYVTLHLISLQNLPFFILYFNSVKLSSKFSDMKRPQNIGICKRGGGGCLVGHLKRCVQFCSPAKYFPTPLMKCPAQKCLMIKILRKYSCEFCVFS
jgi:hypothetical protein